MEQLVLLLIIAGISLINWLVEKSKKLREQKQFEKSQSQPRQAPAGIPEPEPVVTPRSAQEEDSSDQMRRLLEAMGIPTEFPGEQTVELPSPIQAALPEPPPLPQAPLATPPRPTLRKKRPASVARTENPTRWSKHLRSRSALREAIVLREILGPPRALSQP